MIYAPQKFNIPALDGISEKTIEEHLKLYEGYVKHVNVIEEKLNELSADPEKNAYAMSEVGRRLGFEFGGMKNHEAYFTQFEGGPAEIGNGKLKGAIEEGWGSFDAWLTRFKQLAATRGVGWAMLYHDSEANRLVETWVDEQHIGQLADVKIVIGLDMWEHSYMLDYTPSEKKKYIDAFFKNLNWSVCEKRIG